VVDLIMSRMRPPSLSPPLLSPLLCQSSRHDFILNPPRRAAHQRNKVPAVGDIRVGGILRTRGGGAGGVAVPTRERPVELRESARRPK